MSEVKECCPCPAEEINVPITGITVPFCGFGVNIDASKLPKCECEIATPVKDGLVPSGGKAGQYYGVNKDGTTYGFKDFPIADKESLGGIIVGDGLEVEDSGRLSVDFSEMPTDKFEELLKTLRVPQWLTNHRTWYVRIDGSDNNDGTENTPEKAFRTIQHAVNYVSENFNLGQWNATIQIADGEYEESVALPKYTAGAGTMIIQGMGEKTKVKATDASVFYGVPNAGAYSLTNLACHVEGVSNKPLLFVSGISAQSGVRLSLSYITVYGYEQEGTSADMRLIGSNGGVILLYGAITLHARGKMVGSQLNCLLADSGGIIEQHGNGSELIVDGQGLVFFVAREQSSFIRRIAYSPHPKITGTFTGTKYYCSHASIANIGGEGGNYFPGTVEGYKDESCFIR